MKTGRPGTIHVTAMRTVATGFVPTKLSGTRPPVEFTPAASTRPRILMSSVPSSSSFTRLLSETQGLPAAFTPRTEVSGLLPKILKLTESSRLMTLAPTTPRQTGATVNKHIGTASKRMIALRVMTHLLSFFGIAPGHMPWSSRVGAAPALFPRRPPDHSEREKAATSAPTNVNAEPAAALSLQAPNERTL